MSNIEQGSSGNLTPLLTGVNILPYTILGNGKITVSTPGSASALGVPTTTASITIRALASNTGKVYVGTASVSSSNGFQLSPQETMSLDLNNLNKIWLDVDNAGEGVTYFYIA